MVSARAENVSPSRHYGVDVAVGALLRARRGTEKEYYPGKNSEPLFHENPPELHSRFISLSAQLGVHKPSIVYHNYSPLSFRVGTPLKSNLTYKGTSNGFRMRIF